MYTKYTLLSLFCLFTLHISGQVQISFDHSNPISVSNLIGFNTGFNHRHMVVRNTMAGITNYSDQIKPELIEAFAKIQSPVLRFPGGVIANFYHLYPQNFDCPSSDEICINDFAKGYGLRQNELATSNNNPISEWNFENNSNNEITDNWIVAFANLIEDYQTATGDTVEIIFMLNVLSHFEFNNQNAQFTGDIPNENNPDFQRNLREIGDALKYLIEVRNLKVVATEMGTELYFNNWTQFHGVNVDRFIALIPIYRNLLDNLGYSEMPLGVPINHSQSLAPTADNWSRKIADQSYNPNQMYDSWIIHDYHRLVEPCDAITCNGCNNWEDEECSLYTQNVNSGLGIINCEPDGDSPSSEDLEFVFEKKIERFAPIFNNELSLEYEDIHTQLQSLSSKTDGRLWLTEWNLLFDNGCSQWKGINQFFANTFLHGVHIFDLLHNFYRNEQIEWANFHSFSASNTNYPIINASPNGLNPNGSYYPFLISSNINHQQLQKININSALPPPETATFFAYIGTDINSNEQDIYLYYTNKTTEAIPLEFSPLSIGDSLSNVSIQYISADAFHSSADGNYPFNDVNVDVSAIDFSNAEVLSSLDLPYSLPPLSYGCIQLSYTQLIDGASNLISDLAFSIFPNPAKDQFFLNIETGAYKLEVFNHLGESIAIQHINGSTSIATGLWNEGVFFIQIEDLQKAKTSAIQKLVLQR